MFIGLKVTLLKQIERKRADINELYENSFLTDDKVLLESRKLDELLNMFTNMQDGKKAMKQCSIQVFKRRIFRCLKKRLLLVGFSEFPL